MTDSRKMTHDDLFAPAEAVPAHWITMGDFGRVLGESYQFVRNYWVNGNLTRVEANDTYYIDLSDPVTIGQIKKWMRNWANKDDFAQIKARVTKMMIRAGLLES